MMIRSMPPASSHFAERPVPAPPPTIGDAALHHVAEPGEDVTARNHWHDGAIPFLQRSATIGQPASRFAVAAFRKAATGSGFPVSNCNSFETSVPY